MAEETQPSGDPDHRAQMERISEKLKIGLLSNGTCLSLASWFHKELLGVRERNGDEEMWSILTAGIEGVARKTDHMVGELVAMRARLDALEAKNA